MRLASVASVATVALAACLMLAAASAHGAKAPPPAQNPLPNFDRRAGTDVPVPAPTARARRTLSQALGDQGQVATDELSGGVALAGRSDGLLTGPSARDPEQIVLDYVRNRPTVFGLSARDIANLKLVARSVSPAGITHLRFNQVLNGVPAYDNGLAGHVTADGRLIRVTGAPMGGARLGTTAPALSASAALGRARANVAGSGAPPAVERRQADPTRATAFVTGERSELRWIPGSDGPELVWQVTATGVDRAQFTVLVTADEGRAVLRQSLTHDLGGHAHHFPVSPDRNPRDGEGLAPVGGPMPAEWYDDHAGGTRLWGQYARTYLDPTGSNPPPGAEDGPGPIQVPASDGAPDEPNWRHPQTPLTPSDSNQLCPTSGCTWDPSHPPSADTNALQAATNAHLLVSRFAEHLAQPPIGFSEADGNFQRDNVSGDGFDGDYMRVEVNDGSGLDNARIFTGADGMPARMELFLWRDRGVNSADDAAVVYHEYTHGMTNRLVTTTGGNPGLGSFQSSVMGEGWSDYFALDLLEHEGQISDDPEQPGEVTIGEYLAGPGGLRAKAIDCPVDPLSTIARCNDHFGSAGVRGGYTFGDLATTWNRSPHSPSELWSQVLWDIRTALGRDVANEVIVEAMRTSAAHPSMIDMRDSMLTVAPLIAPTEDADQRVATLWEIFARRGLGRSAQIASADNAVGDEAFDQPTDLELGAVTVSDPYPAGDGDGVAEAGEQVELTLPLTNRTGQSLAGAEATVEDPGGLTFDDDRFTWPELAADETADGRLVATLPASCARVEPAVIAVRADGQPPARMLLNVDPRPLERRTVALETVGPTVIPFTVKGTGPIANLELHLDRLDHPWLGDLTIRLVHPDGTTAATIIDRPGKTESLPRGWQGRDIVATVFADGGSALSSQGFGPITGRVQPTDALAIFDGLPASGTWELQITDAYLDTDLPPGALRSWALVGDGIDCGRLEIPTAVTEPASAVGPSSATLAGTIAPNGRETDWRFAYGVTPAFGSYSDTFRLDADDESRSESAVVTGLAASTTFYYRIETLRAGRLAVAGQTRSFTTAAAPVTAPPPPVTVPTTDPTPPVPPPPPAPAPTPQPPTPTVTDPPVPPPVAAPRFRSRPRASLLASPRGAKNAARRVQVRVALSAPARVNAVLSRELPGVHRGRRCVAPPRRPAPGAKPCVRLVTVARVGANVTTTAPTTVMLPARRLQPGRHRVVLTATDRNGRRSPTSTLPLIVRR